MEGLVILVCPFVNPWPHPLPNVLIAAPPLSITQVHLVRDEQDFLYLSGLQELDRELLLAERSEAEKHAKSRRRLLRKRISKVSYLSL